MQIDLTPGEVAQYEAAYQKSWDGPTGFREVTNLLSEKARRIAPEFHFRMDPSDLIHPMTARHMDAIDAELFTGDIASDPERRPVIEGMIVRWVRRLVEETLWEPDQEFTDEQIKERQRENAKRLIALILGKCRELNIDL
jgi:hypothetical protein